MGKIKDAFRRDYVGFAKECTDRAKGWLEKYQGQPAYVLGSIRSRLDRLSILTARRRKLELAIKNFNAAIAEVEVEMAYLDEEIKNQ